MSVASCHDDVHVLRYPWGTVSASSSAAQFALVRRDIDPDGEPVSCCWLSMIERRRRSDRWLTKGDLKRMDEAGLIEWADEDQL